MSKVQNNSKTADLRLSWSEAEALDFMTSTRRKLEYSNLTPTQENLNGIIRSWLLDASAQELFNAAIVLANSNSSTQNYLDGEKMVETMSKFSLDDEMIMYHGVNGHEHKSREEMTEYLVEKYGRTDNDEMTIECYVKKIFIKKGVTGAIEAADLVEGGKRYLREAMRLDARIILDVLTSKFETTELLRRFTGDFMLTYALTALSDVACTLTARETPELCVRLLCDIGINRK